MTERFWSSYFEQRISAAINNSRLIDQLKTGCDQQLYCSALDRSAGVIAEHLKFDPRRWWGAADLELFLALTDGWVSNFCQPWAANDRAEGEYLIQAGRLLAGKIKPAQEPRLLAERYQRWINNCDEEATTALRVELEDFSEESLLSPIRQRLGITDSFWEADTEAIVLAASCQNHSEQWQQLVEMKNVSGLMVDHPDQPSIGVMVLPVDVIDAFNTDQADKQQWAKRVIFHEYVHTQRPLLAGLSGQMGLFFSEFAALHLSEDGSYPDTQWLMSNLDLLSLGQFIPKFERLLAQPDFDEEAFYSCFSDTFGFQALLLMSASRPKEYARSAEYVSIEIPGIDQSQPEPKLAIKLYDIIGRRQPALAMALAARQNPGWAKRTLEWAMLEKVPLPDAMAEQLLQF